MHQMKLLRYPGIEHQQYGLWCACTLAPVMNAMQVCPGEIRQGDHKRDTGHHQTDHSQRDLPALAE